MKKTLLLSLLATTSIFTLNAQQRLAKPIQGQTTAKAISKYQQIIQKRIQQKSSKSTPYFTIKADNESAGKTSTFFYRPLGVYFLGPDQDLTAPLGRCIAPANTLLGTSASVNSNSFDWDFYTLDESTNTIVEKKTKDKNIEFSLPEGLYPAPVLTGHLSSNATETDSIYTFTKDSIEFGNGYNNQFYACNFDPSADLLNVATNYFYTNDSTATKGLSSLIRKDATNVKLKTFEEFFEYSNRPYYLLGGAAHIYSDNTLTPKDLIIKFKKLETRLDEKGEEQAFETVLDDTVKITEIKALEGNVFYIRYEVPTKPQITTPLSIVLAPSNNLVKITPLFIPQKIYNEDAEGGYSYITLDFDFKGKEHRDEPLDVSGFQFGKGTLMSWMMGLFMTYDKDLATGVHSVGTTQPLSNNIYTLKGQKVNGNLLSLPKGIYIVNGKKVLIK